MNRGLMFSSKEEKWQTPDNIFNELNEEFNFTLDPCCQHDSAKCKKYYTPVEDGLKQDWEGETVFVNPPYGRALKIWVEKCFNEAKKKDTIVVMLIPARTDTAYFHDYIYNKHEIRFLRGRIKFVDPNTKKQGDSAPFPTMVVVMRRLPLSEKIRDLKEQIYYLEGDCINKQEIQNPVEKEKYFLNWLKLNNIEVKNESFNSLKFAENVFFKIKGDK